MIIVKEEVDGMMGCHSSPSGLKNGAAEKARVVHTCVLSTQVSDTGHGFVLFVRGWKGCFDLRAGVTGIRL